MDRTLSVSNGCSTCILDEAEIGRPFVRRVIVRPETVAARPRPTREQRKAGEEAMRPDGGSHAA